MSLPRHNFFRFVLRFVAVAAFLSFIFYPKPIESSYLPVTGSNIGIGTSTPVGGFVIMNGNVGIGTWSPVGVLEVKMDNGAPSKIINLTGSFADLAGTRTGLYADVTAPVVGAGLAAGSWSQVRTTANAGTYTSAISGAYNESLHSGNATVEYLIGALTLANQTGSGPVTYAYGLYPQVWKGAGTITNAYGLYYEGVPDANGDTLDVSGTVVNQFGLAFKYLTQGTTRNIGIMLDDLTDGASIIGNFGIYEEAAYPNYLAGNVGVGTWQPAGHLSVFSSGTTRMDSTSTDITGAFANESRYTIGQAGQIRATPSDVQNFRFFAGSGAFQEVVQIKVNTPAMDGAAVLGAVDFYTQDLSGLVNRMSITNTGVIVPQRVGIGTTNPVGALAVMNGNVGIGTWSPVGSLEVRGGAATRIWTGAGTDTNATSAGELYVEGDLEVDGTIYGDGAGLTGVSGLTVAGGWSDGGTNVYTTTTTDNVGIGTTTPTAALLIENPGTQASFRINDAVLDSSPFIVMADGNVGIGTTGPIGKMSIVGTSSEKVIMNLGGGITPSNSASFNIWNDGMGTPTIALFGLSDTAGGDRGGFYFKDNASPGDWGSPLLEMKAMGCCSENNPEIRGLIEVDNSGWPGLKFTAQTVAGAALSASPAFIWNNQNTELMRISANGNVGIGTTTPVAGLAVMNGNVGIGTWSPTAGFEVKFSAAKVWTGAGTNTNATDAGEMYVEGDLEVDGTIYGDGSGLTGVSGLTVAGGWTDGGTNVYTSTTTDNVGIGTTTPTAALLVENAGTQDSFRVNDGVLDASPFVINATGEVGVGTTTPVSTISVVGNIGIGTYAAYRTIAGPNNGMIVEGKVGIGTFNPTSALTIGSGQIFMPNGSQSAPSYSFSNYTNAGFTANGDGGFGFYVNGGTVLALYSNSWRFPVASVSLVDSTTGNKVLRFATNNAVANSSTNAIKVTSAASGSTPILGVQGDSDTDISLNIAAAGSGSVNFISGNVGLGTTLPAGALTVMNGNVGIGTWSPTAGFEVKSSAAKVWTGAGTNTNATDAGEMYVEGDLEVDGTIYGDGAGLTGVSGLTVAGGWSDGGTNVYTSTTTDLVAIGTTTPASSLTVYGNVGIGSTAPYQTIAAPDGNLIVGGRVGIGTWSPRETLTVGGNGSAGGTPGFAVRANDVSGSSWFDVGLGGPGIVRFGADGGSSQVANIGDLGARFNIGSLFSASNALAISGVASQTGDLLRVDTDGSGGNQFKITANGSVGINTTVPASLLTVAGGVAIGTHRNSAFLQASSSSGALLVESNVGIGTTTPEGALTVMNGNVGIGTWSPTQRLQVIGTVDATAFVGDGSGLTNLPGGAGGWTDGGTNVYTSTTTDNVGIGTTTPISTLTVKGNVGIGTSLAYQIIPAPSGGMIVEGNVGIGTSNPAKRLDVDGNMRMTGTWFYTGSSGNFWPVRDGGVAAGGKFGSLVVSDNYAETAPTNGMYIKGNLGIGTFSPASILDINGAQTVREIASASAPTPAAGKAFLYADDTSHTLKLSLNGAAYGDLATTSGVSTNYVAKAGDTMTGPLVNNSNSASTALAVTQSGAGNAATFMGGNVGIGTWSTTQRLQVIGTVDATAFVGDGSGLTNLPGGAGGWSDGGTNVYTTTTTDNVGIGTTTPSSTFEIVKTAVGTAPLMVSTTATGDGDLLVITSSGNVGIGTSTPTGGLVIMNGNVGIGTTSPASSLGISGDITFSDGANRNISLGTTAVGQGYDLSIKAGNGAWPDGGGALHLSAGDATYGETGAYINLAASSGHGGPVTIQGGAGDPGFASSGGEVSIIGGNGLNYGGSIYLSVGTGSVTIGDVILAHDGTSGRGNVGIGTTTPVGGFAVMNGNVGIGTWSPTQRLQVIGTVDATAFVGDGSGLTNLPGGAVGWTDGGTNVYTSTTTDNVGIGTTTPTAVLLVENAGAQDSFRVNDAILDDSPFIVDAAGNVGIGTTTPVSTLTLAGNIGIGTYSAYRTIAGPNNGIIAEGNVGIGTWNPGTRLQVNNTASYVSEYNNGTQAVGFNVDWNNGNKQVVTLGAAGLGMTFTAPSGGVANLMLKIKQDGSGSRTISSWPGDVRWPGGTAPTLTLTGGAIDIVTCYYDRDKYYCTNSLDFQ